MAHAASAYYLSPWDISEEVLIFTADAAGDGLSSTINFGKKGKIERLENSENLYYDSLGYCFYDVITSLIMISTSQTSIFKSFTSVIFSQ